MNELREYLEKVSMFAREAESVFASCESSPHRITTLEASFKRLKKLSLRQEELFSQSLNCAKNHLFKASYVMAWAAFMDFLYDKLDENFSAIKKAYPKWNAQDSEELRKEKGEYQILEAAKKVKLFNHETEEILKGYLRRRHQCAHPTGYNPDINTTLGYISELLGIIEKIGNNHPRYP